MGGEADDSPPPPMWGARGEQRQPLQEDTGGTGGGAEDGHIYARGVLQCKALSPPPPPLPLSQHFTSLFPSARCPFSLSSASPSPF